MAAATAAACRRAGRNPCRSVIAVAPFLLSVRLELPGGSVRQGETPEVSVRRELAEETGLVANTPLQLLGEVCSVWDGRIDRVFLFVLRFDRLPTLQFDNREIIGAQLVPIEDLHKVPLTGPVQAYVRGQFSPIGGGADQSFS